MKQSRIKIRKTTFGFVFKTPFDNNDKFPVTWDTGGMHMNLKNKKK